MPDIAGVFADMVPRVRGALQHDCNDHNFLQFVALSVACVIFDLADQPRFPLFLDGRDMVTHIPCRVIERRARKQNRRQRDASLPCDGPEVQRSARGTFACEG